jgi:hypothetical protein
VSRIRASAACIRLDCRQQRADRLGSTWLPDTGYGVLSASAEDYLRPEADITRNETPLAVSGHSIMCYHFVRKHRLGRRSHYVGRNATRGQSRRLYSMPEEKRR